MLLYGVKEGVELEKLTKIVFSESQVYIVDDEKSLYLWFGKKADDKSKEFAIKKARIFNKERKESAKLLLLDQDQEYGEFLAMMDKLKEGLRSDATIERRPELDLQEPWNADKAELEPEPEVNPKTDLEEYLLQAQTYRSSAPEEKIEPEVTSKSELDEWLLQIQTHRSCVPEEKIESEISEKEEKAPEPIQEELQETQEDKGNLEDQIRVDAYFLSQRGLSYDLICWMLAETQLNIMKGLGNVSENEIREKAEQVFKSSSSYDELCWLISELNCLIRKGYFEE